MLESLRPRQDSLAPSGVGRVRWGLPERKLAGYQRPPVSAAHTAPASSVSSPSFQCLPSFRLQTRGGKAPSPLPLCCPSPHTCVTHTGSPARPSSSLSQGLICFRGLTCCSSRGHALLREARSLA